MSGVCADYSSSPRLGAQGASVLSSNLCGMRSGPYMGLTTYNDGRVVQIAPDQDAQHPSVRRTSAQGQPAVYEVEILSAPGSTERTTLRGISQAQLDLVRSLQGNEIGLCFNNGGSFQVQTLPITSGTSPILWTPRHMSGLLRLFNNQPDNVFFCADGDRQGVVGLNTSSGQGLVLSNALQSVREPAACASVLGAGSETQCQVLRGVADRLVPQPPDHNSELWRMGFLFTGVHLVGSFGVWLATYLWGRFRGGPPSGGSGPSSPSGGTPPARPANGSREIDLPAGGPTPQVAQRQIDIAVAEGDGDGAGVRLIHTMVDAAAAETPAPVTSSPAPLYPYNDHDNRAAWYLLGGAALVGLAFVALPAEAGAGGLVLAGAL